MGAQAHRFRDGLLVVLQVEVWEGKSTRAMLTRAGPEPSLLHSPSSCAGAQLTYGRTESIGCCQPQPAPVAVVVVAAVPRIAGGLAQKCFDTARSHEPTNVLVWEAMGDAALRASTRPGDAAAREALDAYEHAQVGAVGRLVFEPRDAVGIGLAVGTGAAPLWDLGS